MYGNQPSQAATLAARMASLGKPPKLGPRPISDRPLIQGRPPSVELYGPQSGRSMKSHPKPIPDPQMRPPDGGHPPTIVDEGPVPGDRVPRPGDDAGRLGDVGVIGQVPLGTPWPAWTGQYPPGTIANHNPLFNALRDKILSQTKRPGNQNQTALLARFLGVM